MGWFSKDSILENIQDNLDVEVEEAEDVTIYHVALVIALTATCLGLGYRIYEAYNEEGTTVELRPANQPVTTSPVSVSSSGNQFLDGFILTFIVAAGNYMVYHFASGVLDMALGKEHFMMGPTVVTAQDYFSKAQDLDELSLSGGADVVVETSSPAEGGGMAALAAVGMEGGEL